MTTAAPLRLAMWSGPRNISTALMRSWGNRPDSFVWDEPLYAHYLYVTGRDHPFADEVIAAGETDWRQVVDSMTGDVPEGKRVFYQKQMTHHLLPDIDRGWIDQVTNCFLIRDPREMLTSYIKKVPDPTMDDLGFPQQFEVFELARRHGQTPPVIDSTDVLENPRRVLSLLCDAVGVEFTDAMLSWPPGRRETDGVWAKHWYPEVEKSTSFRPYKPKADQVPDHLRDLYDQCVDYYHRFYQHRLR